MDSDRCITGTGGEGFRSLVHKGDDLMSQDTDRYAALVRAVRILMREYRHVMGPDTPEISDVYAALEGTEATR